MRHSLLNRFRGALLGAALGEVLGANCLTAQSRGDQAVPHSYNQSWLDVEQWGFSCPTVPTALGKRIVAQARSVLQNLRHFDPAQWALSTREAAPTDVALTALPLLLFYHDDLTALHAWLQPALPAAAYLEVSLLSYMFSLTLREQLQPDRLIPRLLTDLDLDRTAPDLVEQLVSVDRLVTQRAGIALAQATLLPLAPPLAPVSPLLLALYGVLSTPNNTRLALCRVARMQYQPPLTCALAGALCGALNGDTELPQDWWGQLAGDRSPLPHCWGLTGAQLIQLAEQLLAAWSGVQAAHLLPLAAVVAAPGTIRFC